MALQELWSSDKVVGMRQTLKALQRDKVSKVFVASDVDSEILEEVISLAREKDIPLEYVDSAEELGKACGIEVGASCAAILR
ncbi:MAG: large subunit ribosomal protein [Candidatus Atribacteria bacterium]|jgi:large subunit ribosomal protein L7A|uniref:Ribosomal L7Ae/L30e/S12e/Gadd45 family protein n=1 Tax=Thermatribacter velox TaxID=3039681 RepID=A0ABZ2YCJ7_9BACT|nr:large subunit ribosomal protein [Candidatus Atribacteria bacterium]